SVRPACASAMTSRASVSISSDDRTAVGLFDIFVFLRGRILACNVSGHFATILFRGWRRARGATGTKVKKQQALRGKGSDGMIRAVVVVTSLAAGLGVAAAQTESVQSTTTQAPTSAKPKPAGKQTAPKQAPAKSGPKQAAVPAEGGRCVGVLSRLGAVFTLTKIGIIALQNEERRVPIEEWHVDDLIAARVGEFLGKRAVVRRVPWSR